MVLCVNPIRAGCLPWVIIFYDLNFYYNILAAKLMFYPE